MERDLVLERSGLALWPPRLLQAIDVVDVDFGDVLVHAGQRATWAGIVYSGEVLAVCGRGYVTIGEGCWFGVRAVLLRAASTATVTVATPGRVGFLEVRRLLTAVETVPGFALRLLRCGALETGGP